MQFTGTYSKPQWKNTYLALRYNSKCERVVGLQIMLQINIPTLDTTQKLACSLRHSTCRLRCLLCSLSQSIVAWSQLFSKTNIR